MPHLPDVAGSYSTQVQADHALLRVASVTRRFGDVTAVDRLSLDIRSGEFFALLGPSGCGKSTLLRMLAGFETPDDGQIFLGDSDIAPIPPHQRPVNMMFQSYALFPHLDVTGNIAFGLKRASLPRDEINIRIAEMIALTRLTGLERRRPHQLSGGQRQRVALARSLARRPKLLLLDEPMAALDRKLRETTQAELKELQRKLGLTFIIVTHDQEEAMIVADRIGVMNEGRLVQVGTPREVYEAPNCRWVAGFVGDVNLLEGTVERAQDGVMQLQTRDAGPVIVATNVQPARGTAVTVALRPETIHIASGQARPDRANVLHGTLVDSHFLGGFSAYRVRLPSRYEMRVSCTNEIRAGGPSFATGQSVVLSFPADAGIVLET